MNSEQAYKTLNIDDNSTMDQVKSAYRKLALEHHPDKTQKNDDLNFKRITEAYHIIKKQGKPKRPQKKWGAPPRADISKGAPPEQDWSKYTKEFEEDESFWKEYESKFWKMYDENINSYGKNNEHQKAQEPQPQPDLSVDVDPSLCIGCCSCETIAPEVFTIDKKVKMNPKSKVYNRKGAKFNKIMSAAETCPTKAINIVNLTTRKKLFPRGV